MLQRNKYKSFWTRSKQRLLRDFNIINNIQMNMHFCIKSFQLITFISQKENNDAEHQDNKIWQLIVCIISLQCRKKNIIYDFF